MAAIAVALRIDPMDVLDWPGDIFDAVQRILAGDLPVDHDAQVLELQRFAQQLGSTA